MALLLRYRPNRVCHRTLRMTSSNGGVDGLVGLPGWPPGSSSQVDILGARCPISAHIRKVNPRDQGSDLGPPADNLRRSILRRGIPYGKALPSDNSDDADRGLLFLCYQASIEDTFETITQDWMNSTAGPTPPQSFDMLIGRNPNGGERFCFFGATRVATKELFVYPTGGGYFFTPAISGIRDVLSVD